MKFRTESSKHADINPHDGGYIPILDGWRAVAILLVLFFHGYYNSDPVKSLLLRHATDFLGRTGALGVLIFFAISGYLITLRLRHESRVTGHFSVRVFYIKRIFRILPPLAFYLIIIAVLFLLHGISLQLGDWAAPVFLSNYVYGSWYTSHFWSLSVEEHFYLFWPICIIVAGWRRSTWIGIALIVAVGLWRPWELLHVSAPARALQHTDMRLDYIMMGCVVCLVTECYPVTARLLSKLGTAPGIIALLFALGASTLRSPIDLRSLQALIITLLVCASSVADGRISKLLLANRVMLFIGKISYSLYIWQQLFLGPMSSSFWRSPLTLPLKYVAAFAAAYLSYRFVEQPFIRYGRTLLRKPTRER